MRREEIVELDQKHIWRPYTSSEDHKRQDPFVIERAEGVWLYDMNGQRYFDGNGSWWCNTLGHGHPRIKNAMREQSETLLHCSLAGTTHPQIAKLAQKLANIAPPGLNRAFFSDNGSTAVEMAIKTCIQYWHQNGRPERKRFLALSQAFHGDTIGASSVGDVGAFKQGIGELLFDVYRAPDPEEKSGWERVVEAMEKTLAENSETIAGVIVEPLIQGAAGMRIWPAELLKRLRIATEKSDTFLVADEVFVGYGRTGTMWACDQANITPDLLCTAKAFSGGVLPMSATLVTDRIFQGFEGDKSRALMYGHTFCGNPLGAAIASEVLSIYEDEKILEQVQHKALLIKEAFDEISKLPGVARTRSLGMVAAADLGQGGYLGKQGWKIHELARQRGVYLRPLGDTIYITPPFVTQESDLQHLLKTIQACIVETR